MFRARMKYRIRTKMSHTNMVAIDHMCLRYMNTKFNKEGANPTHLSSSGRDGLVFRLGQRASYCVLFLGVLEDRIVFNIH